MSRIAVYEPRFVSEVPEVLEVGVLYVSMVYATSMHLCACGCGSLVVTPLRPGQWLLVFDGTVTLRPSVGNWSFSCRSHYFIDRNRVVWAWARSDREVRDARASGDRGAATRPTWRRWLSRRAGQTEEWPPAAKAR